MIGLLRVKNEARWITRVIASLRPLCARIVVMDDHSTDGTATLCSAAGAEVLASPFDSLDETRDKNWLMAQVGVSPGDWVAMIDGDEILLPGYESQIHEAMKSGAQAIALRVLYAWDSEDQFRVDGVYGKFRRASIFRFDGQAFQGGACGFHCGNAPAAIRYNSLQTDIPLLHLGYLERADRLRKYAWYNENDPDNVGEDCYRHIVQGDIPEVPAESQLMHAGPLRLESIPICQAAA